MQNGTSAGIWSDGRKTTFAALFIGYAGYFVCRSVLPVAQPLILDEYASAGVDKEFMGWVGTAGIASYMVGKLVTGALADRLGGRVLFIAGMLGSAAATFVFGFVGFALFTAIWGVNRFCQSAGWGGLVQVVSRRFPPMSHATIMGLLSMSFLLGDAVVRLYLGSLLDAGVGWRGLFTASALTLAAIGVGCAIVLRRKVESVEAVPATTSEDWSGAVKRLVRTPAFWLVCVLSGGMTLLRETFNYWTPTFLNEFVGMGQAGAAAGSAVFPICGALSAVLAGYASDRWRGRRGPVIVVALLGLTAVLIAVAFAPLAGNPTLALILLAAAAFFVTGPYSFCAGVLALDLGGKRGAATAAGLIDAAGYLCALYSGAGIGAVAQRAGWSAAFLTLAGVAIVTALAGLIYAIFAEREH